MILPIGTYSFNNLVPAIAMNSEVPVYARGTYSKIFSSYASYSQENTIYGLLAGLTYFVKDKGNTKITLDSIKEGYLNVYNK